MMIEQGYKRFGKGDEIYCQAASFLQMVKPTKIELEPIN